MDNMNEIREFRLHKLVRHLGPKLAYLGPGMGKGGPKQTQPITSIVLGSQNKRDTMNKIVKFRLHILVRRLGPNWAYWGPGNG